MAAMPEKSVDLIVADPPYYRVKQEYWDRAWKTFGDYMAWFETILQGFKRIMKPNASMYCFCSPQYSSKTEGLIGDHFNVLNHIVWLKRSSIYRRANIGSFRSFFPQTERIIFAEYNGLNNEHTFNENNRNGRLCKQIVEYLNGERLAAGLGRKDIMEICGNFTVSQHSFAESQFELPTRENYERLQTTGFFLREYDDLRREYDDLRRTFNVKKGDQITDVWDFNPVITKGKHPCEKPQPLLTHIIKTSSREGDAVFDPFGGTASCAIACINANRKYIGVEKDGNYYGLGAQRIEQRIEVLV